MVTVVKANGETEPFSEEKLLRSIQRAGIPLSLQEEVVHHIASRLHNNITSKEIYRHIIEYFGKSQQPFARSRYSLKEAIMLLGPTGYPFEDFIASVLKHNGYQVKTRQIMRGACITHEIDVIGRKDGKTAMIEAKFHNNVGTRTEVHVALYTKSRFDDVKLRYHFDEAWIVTNTKATVDAIAFAECMGMKILSWSYPEKGSLRDLIETAYLFPITSLSSLSRAQKTKLLADHVVLCREICESNFLLDVLHLTREERNRVLDEVSYLCHRNIPVDTLQQPLQRQSAV